MDELWQIYMNLRKVNSGPRQGEIATKKGDYGVRQGITRKPILRFLDITDSYGVFHGWLRDLARVLKIIYHYMARDDFPDGVPVMRKGESKGEAGWEGIEAAKEFFTTKAKEPPLSMELDQVDPHGNGGTTNTGMLKNF